MSGQFLGVVVEPREHKCSLPSGSKPNAYPDHTVWRCECGKAYRWVYGGSQYNEDWYHWVRYEAMDA